MYLRTKNYSLALFLVVGVAVFITGCEQSTSSQQIETIEAIKAPENIEAEGALVSGSKFVGNIVGDPNNIPSNFTNYWNQVTPENAGKWDALEPSQGDWNWGPLDDVYNFAQTNGIPFRQHTFVWGSQEPGWVSGESQGAQRGALEYFIETFFDRYPNTAMVDVVNEPLHAPPSYTAALGGSGSTGWDWVIESFEIAQQHNSGAQLMINEYGIISDPSAAQQYRQIIDLLNNRGLIDAIGIQCHAFNMDNVDTGTMNQVLDILAGSGLPIYVTELDIRGSDSQQRDRYAEKFPVFWEHPSVAGVTLWGYQEGTMWQDGAHLIRSDGSERPALQWLRDYLSGNTGGDNGDDGDNSSGSGSNTIVVRAQGANSEEEINVRVDGQTLATFNLSTSYQNYTVNTNSTGEVDVEFFNDASGRDVQVDYVEVNGDVRQAEDQADNTAAYDGQCGGGSYTEMMHCNGTISFGSISGGSSGNSLVVRARGTNGDEQINLQVDGQTIDTFTLSTSYQNYSATTSLTGGILVEFFNDASGRDVQVDYVEVNGQVRQAEDQSYNTGVWDGECGGGSNSEWMHCDGVIGFGDVN